jgi:hypothetical protein
MFFFSLLYLEGGVRWSHDSTRKLHYLVIRSSSNGQQLPLYPLHGLVNILRKMAQSRILDLVKVCTRFFLTLLILC